MSSFMRVAMLLCAGLLPLSAPTQAQAQTQTQAQPGLPDAEERQIIERLTRGIRVPSRPAPSSESLPGTPAPAEAGKAPPAAMPPAAMAEPPSINLTVFFPTGSARLTPEAAEALAALGRALNREELRPFRFRVEGHTDTEGDAGMNQWLSERRAAAVRAHLVEKYGIAPRRLLSQGLGESQLLVRTPDNVPEPRNRRVQIVNLGE